MKFKCKPAIDTLFARLGDTLAAATVWFGTHVVILSTRGYSLLTVVLVLLWIATAIVMIREHRRLSESNPSPGKAECQ
jgi:ATP/ADP translocase